MSLEDVTNISRQLEGEVQMYDALTREYTHGNKQAVELDEVREWGMRNLEVINKALFSLHKKCADEFPDKKSRDNMINSLFYLKERITAIEKTAMTAEPFRSVSPKGKAVSSAHDGGNNLTKFGQSMGTTSAASIRQEGRDNPFNQVVHVVGSASRSKGGPGEYTPNANDNVSHCSSAVRRINDPSYFSNMKDNTANNKEYRTYDNRRDENEEDRITRSDLAKQPFQSAYGRELSEQMEAQRRINAGSNAGN